MEIRPVRLIGQIVHLEPLSLSHLADLAEVGLDPEIWRFMLYGDVRTIGQLRTWIQDLLARQQKGTDLPFAVIYAKSGNAVGATRYLNIDTANRNLEIGGTWLGRTYQRTGVNAESKYLLLRHAFEVWGCVRVQLKTDLRNTQSQRAIERLGAVREGIIRKHLLLPSGEFRDSVFYSILDTEWPRVKALLEERIRQKLA